MKAIIGQQGGQFLRLTSHVARWACGQKHYAPAGDDGGDEDVGFADNDVDMDSDGGMVKQQIGQLVMCNGAEMEDGKGG